MNIYGELYFLQNFILDYIMIDTTSSVLNLYYHKKKAILASFLGALYAMVYFCDDLLFLYNILFKILFIILIVYIVFGYINIKEFAKVCIGFCVIHMCICGSIFFIIYFTGISHIRLSYLIVGVYLSCKCTEYMYKNLKKSNICKNTQKDIVVSFDNTQIKVRALLDTGNLLVDPIGKNPVVIVDVDKLKEILPKDVLFVNYDDLDMEKIDFITSKLSQNLYCRFKLIPYSAIGNKKKILVGLKCDYIEFNDVKKSNVIIGISNLSKDNEYNAILNPNLI